MKTIEKINSYGDTQIFEIIENRNELKQFFRNSLHEYLYSEYAKDWHPEGVWEDPDTTLEWYDKEGKYFWISEGEKVVRPNISNISKMISTNACTTVIYGDISIKYNEHYGDWETSLD